MNCLKYIFCCVLGQRKKPEYNLRKPGEGEDGGQWKKAVELKKKEESDEEEEEEVSFSCVLKVPRISKFLPLGSNLNGFSLFFPENQDFLGFFFFFLVNTVNIFLIV